MWPPLLVAREVVLLVAAAAAGDAADLVQPAVLHQLQELLLAQRRQLRPVYTALHVAAVPVGLEVRALLVGALEGSDAACAAGGLPRLALRVRLSIIVLCGQLDSRLVRRERARALEQKRAAIEHAP
jgi:hypothetical protein